MVEKMVETVVGSMVENGGELGGEDGGYGGEIDGGEWWRRWWRRWNDLQFNPIQDGCPEGIEHQTSIARTPEQNDVVKRRNHTLVEAARTMLSAAKVPLFFWAEAIATTYGENLDKMKGKENVPQAAETVTPSNELGLLFSLMFDVLFNGSTKVVSKSSAIHATDAPDQRQQHNTTPSTPTTIAADTPPLNIQTTPDTTSQAPTVTAIKNINQEETHEENTQVIKDEFINIFSTPVHEQGETSS
ncbi:retrovirus-related pol polyprotein from transposon TNT 1-94 [Tanacetum coccineum]